jgi:hypothetical protein
LSKHKCGSFKNVLLTDEELIKLDYRFGSDGSREWIETFSEQKAAKGYKYKSDYAAILAWARRDQKRATAHVHTKMCKEFGFCPETMR